MSANYIKGGGMSLHAPSVIAMGKDAFIAFYIDRITFIESREKRLKYLTGKYEECERLMTPIKHKTGLSTPVEELSTPVEELSTPVDNDSKVSAPIKRSSKSKKHTEKKE